MGHFIYKEGDKIEEIAIVKQGAFELRKKLPNEVSDNHESAINQLVKGLISKDT